MSTIDLALDSTQISALNSILAAIGQPTLSVPMPAAAAAEPTSSGMPSQLKASWAELKTQPDWNVVARYARNGRPVNRYGAFIKGAQAVVTVATTPEPASTPQAATPAAGMTIAQFAASHPEVMADLAAAVLGTVFVAGGSWSAFRIAVLGR